MTFKAMILEGEGIPTYPCRTCSNREEIGLCSCTRYREFLEKDNQIPLSIKMARNQVQAYRKNLEALRRIEAENTRLLIDLSTQWNITKEELEV